MTADDLLQWYRASSDHALSGQIVRCDACALVFISPRPKPDLIVAGYSQAEDPQFVKQNGFRVRTFTRNLQSIVRSLRIKPDRSLRVLDVGCAGGAFPKAAHDLGFSVIGVEPSQWMCKKGQEMFGLDLRPGVLADHAFEPGSFDIVTLWDVIEHLTDPKSVLTQIRGLLKPTGHLIVNYPDFRSLTARMLGMKWPFWLDVHLLYFTRRTLGDMVSDLGFDVVRFSPFWQTLEIGYVLERASQYFSVFGGARRLVAGIGLAQRPVTYNMGQTTLIARPSAAAAAPATLRKAG